MENWLLTAMDVMTHDARLGIGQVSAYLLIFKFVTLLLALLMIIFMERWRIAALDGRE